MQPRDVTQYNPYDYSDVSQKKHLNRVAPQNPVDPVYAVRRPNGDLAYYGHVVGSQPKIHAVPRSNVRFSYADLDAELAINKQKKERDLLRIDDIAGSSPNATSMHLHYLYSFLPCSFCNFSAEYRDANPQTAQPIGP